MRKPILAVATLSLALAAPAMAQTITVTAGDPASTSTAHSPGGRSITAFERQSRTRVGGYYDLEFKQPLGGGDSFFDQHHLSLQVSSHLHDKLLLNAEIGFAHGGALNALDRQGEVKIKQAWADYRISEALTLRSGIVLIPFGIVNVHHDSDVRDTTTRPLMATSIIPSTWMEAGTGLHGVAYPTDDMQLSYEVYVTNGLHDQISAGRGLQDARPSLMADNNGNKALSARLGISPYLGWEIGLNGYTGAYDAGNTRRLTMLGLDNMLKVGPLELVGEYAHVRTDGGAFATTVTNTPLAGPVTTTTTSIAIPGSMQGWYLEARHHFFPDFLHDTFLGRAGGYDQASFTLVGRLGQADTDQAVFDATDKNETVLGVNYRPIPTFVTKLEWQRISEPATGKIADALWSSVAVGF